MWNIALYVNCEYTNKWLFEGSITLFCREIEYWRIYSFFVLILKNALVLFFALFACLEEEEDKDNNDDMEDRDNKDKE